MKVHRNFEDWNQSEKDWITNLDYRPAPGFLGNFGYRKFLKPPAQVIRLIHRMCDVHPDQHFNTLFVQTYGPGERVKEHRDPRNNLGHTLLLIFGDFEGAMSFVEDTTFTLHHGDLLSLECTINGKQGPSHRVSEVTSGRRYALILNTIK